MSKTKKVRELLDERGIEYTTGEDFYYEVTQWDSDGHSHKYYEFDDGTTFASVTLKNATPEQAVEATPWRGTCEVVAERSYDYIYAPVGVVHEMDLSCGHTWHDSWPPSFCPKCGAKVIDEWVTDE